MTHGNILTNNKCSLIVGCVVVQVTGPEVGQAADGVYHGDASSTLGIWASHVEVHRLVHHDLR